MGLRASLGAIHHGSGVTAEFRGRDEVFAPHAAVWVEKPYIVFRIIGSMGRTVMFDFSGNCR